MHYNLFFNGCSFTEGAELDGPDKNVEHQKTHRFSHLVAEELGMTYDNISHSGKSNDWIAIETIKWFKNGNSCDIAIIQMTTQERTLWYENTEPEDILIGRAYSEFSINIFTPSKIKNTKPSTKASYYYYEEYYADFLGAENYYKNLFLLENFFKLNNIKYIFISLDVPPNYNKGWQTLVDTKKITSILPTLIGNRMLNPENFCEDYYSKHKKAEYNFLRGFHPNELGHQKIADYIISQIL